MTCPNCHQVTPVPASGVAGLQASFRVNQLLGIVEEHKKASSSASDSLEKGENVPASPSQPEKILIVCSEHKGREVELYCETCKETICWKCIKKGAKNNNHDYEELSEVFEEYTKEIFASLEPVEEQLAIINVSMSQL